MVAASALPVLPGRRVTGHRVVNSKFPPIAIFDDVASPEDFAAIFEIQALTNPRLRNLTGDLSLISQREIPFGIPGCSYAVAPFTHVNPDGSRFSDGSFGVLYVADEASTALEGVAYHQGQYWGKVPELHFDRIVLRGLTCTFDEGGLADGLVLDAGNPVYASHSYAASRALGSALRAQGSPGLRYRSVRAPGASCWALFTPKPVESVVQTRHYEMIWNGAVSSLHRITA